MQSQEKETNEEWVMWQENVMVVYHRLSKLVSNGLLNGDIRVSQNASKSSDIYLSSFGFWFSRV